MKHTDIKAVSLLTALVLTATALFSCTKNNGEFPDGFFDERDTVNTQTVTQDNNNKDNVNVEVSNSDKTQTDIPEKDSDTTEKVTDKDTTSQNGEEDSSDTKKETETVQAFSHSDEEKAKILSAYREAEEFYYDMLYQNYELDNMDVIFLTSDGYETQYHRVLLEDVNSVSELKALYSMYFTSSFTASCDFSAYKEADGKLYCAKISGSVGKASSVKSVESIDSDHALVVTSGNAARKIPAVKSNGRWLFEGVAIR